MFHQLRMTARDADGQPVRLFRDDELTVDDIAEKVANFITHAPVTTASFSIDVSRPAPWTVEEILAREG